MTIREFCDDRNLDYPLVWKAMNAAGVKATRTSGYEKNAEYPEETIEKAVLWFLKKKLEKIKRDYIVQRDRIVAMARAAKGEEDEAYGGDAY